MRLIKLGLISVVVFFLIITGFSLMIPSNVRISRAANMAVQKAMILDKINNMEAWPGWYPGFDTLELSRPTWKDNRLVAAQAGNISVEITDVTDASVTALFYSGMKHPVVNQWQAIEHTGSDSVTLNWYFDFKLRWYPWEKFSSLLLEKNYGPMLEQGLNNLKMIVERAEPLQ